MCRLLQFGGGVGVCQDGKVRCVSGELSEIQPVEREAFTEAELVEGWRLACQVYARSDLHIEIPMESLATSQRLQVKGDQREVQLEPAVHAEDFELKPPDRNDLRADWLRFTAGIGYEMTAPSPAVVDQFSSKMRDFDWSGRGCRARTYRRWGFWKGGSIFMGWRGT